MTLRPPSSILSAFGRPSSFLFTTPHRHQKRPLWLHPSILHLRLASTSPSSPVGAGRINPPASTLPAPLDVPERKPDQSLFSYAYRSGRAYLAFYKTGVKNVWANYKLTKELKARLRDKTQGDASASASAPSAPPSAAPPTASTSTKGKIPSPSPPPSPLPSAVLTRADFQLLKRNRHDMARVPLFGLLLLIFGEWLPLFIIFFTKVVPYPCRIPTQIRREREKVERRRRDSFRGVGGVAPKPPPPKSGGVGKGEVKEGDVTVKVEGLYETVNRMSRDELLHVSRSLGLHSRLWDRFAGIDHVPPTSVLKYKVRSWLQYLEVDDKLAIRDGKVQELVDEEVRIACEERGIDVLGKSVAELRKRLAEWSEGRKRGDVVSMLLGR